MAPRAARGERSLKDAARSARGKSSKFESVRVEPKRHDVMGQRKVRKPKSTLEHRKRADEERRETLLVEYRNLNRSNKMIDARFGEGDDSLPADEKYYARLQRERLRESRSSKFALEEPSDAIELTHGGRSLGEIEDDELAGGHGGTFGEDELDNNDPSGFGGSDFIKAVHFGGGGEGAVLSQKEALEAAIAKHKLARLDRKEEKERERGLVDRLDADFGDLKALIFASAAKSAAASRPAPAAKPSSSAAGAAAKEESYGDYHQLVATMQSEIKAQPSDRLQSDAEMAAAEQKRLRMLEAERVRRSRPDGEDGGGGGGGGGKGAERRRTDDELYENFEGFEMAGGESAGTMGQAAAEEEMLPLSAARVGLRGKEVEEEEEEDGEQEEGEEEEDGESGASDEEESGEEESEEEEAAPSKPEKPFSASSSEKELPFVIDCPTTAAELESVFQLAGGSLARQKEAMHRTIAGVNVKLHEDNRPKLAALAALLLHRLQALAAASPPLLGQTPPVAAALYSVAQQVPTEVAEAILKRLGAARAQWARARGSSESERHVPLPPGSLALLALCCQIYPLSDFRHSVLTPCTLFVGELLAQETLPRTRVGLRRTLFLCAQALKLIGAVKRYMPELHTTVLRLLRAMLLPPPEGADAPLWSAAANGASGKAKGAWGQASAPQPLSFATLDAAWAGGEQGCGLGANETEQALVDEAGALLGLVQSLLTLHSALPSFVELFTPHLDALSTSAAAPPALAAACQATRAQLELLLARAAANRLPLRMQRAAPVPIKQFNPVFDDDFQPDRDTDPDRDRAALQKLKRQTKKERKGAVRELRKDSAFIAVERAKDKAERDEYLTGRGKRAMAIMEEQEHSWKEQKKIKRDSGKV